MPTTSLPLSGPPVASPAVSDASTVPAAQAVPVAAPAAGASGDSFSAQANASARPAVPKMRIAGIEITGLDVNAIKHGRIQIRIPLEAGDYSIPARFSDANVRVKPNTFMTLEVEIGRGRDGKPAIRDIDFHLFPGVTVTNPIGSLEPLSTGFFPRLFHFDEIRNAMASIVVDGVQVDSQCKLHVKGVVNKGPLGSQPLSELVHLDLPPLDLRLETLIEVFRIPGAASMMAQSMSGPSGAAARGSAGAAQARPGPLEFLRRIAAMTKPGEFAVTMRSAPVNLAAEVSAVRVQARKAQASAQITGQVSLTPEGGLNFMANHDTSILRSGVGVAHLGAEGAVNSTDGLDAMVGVNARLSEMSGVVQPSHDVQVPFQVSGRNNLVAARTMIHRGAGGQTEMRSGSVAGLDVTATCPDPILAAGLSVQLQDGGVHVQARTDLVDDAHGLRLSGAKAQATMGASSTSVDIGGLQLQVNGRLDGHVAVHELSAAAQDNSLTAVGEAGVTMTPAPAVREQFPALAPFRRNMNFNLHGTDRLTTQPVNDGLMPFIEPYVHLMVDDRGVIDPRTPASGEIGSVAMQQRVAELTGAPVRSDNRVTLLVDGVRSLPKRLEMINGATESICLQTLVFKDDTSGMAIAEALIAAKRRGVDVRVIVDSIGNFESLQDLIMGHPVYELMRSHGIRLELYGDQLEVGTRKILEVVFQNPSLLEGANPQTLMTPGGAFKLLVALAQMATGATQSNLGPADVVKLKEGLGLVLGAASSADYQQVVQHFASAGRDGVLDLQEMLPIVQRVARFNHRWHEKYLIVDGRAAIVGGMNIADEYLRGGTGARATSNRISRPAWRDTDMLIEGPAAVDAYRNFAGNWANVSGETLPPALDPATLAIPATEAGGTEVQILQNRPQDDADHSITNFMIESIKSLNPGERVFIGNAYFLPTGALQRYKIALMDAAQRGVDVRIVTNGETSTDAPHVNQAAIYAYRELLAAGVRIFERTGDRTMHMKCASFGTKVASVGSWNADNRSAGINAEVVGVVYNPGFAAQVENMILADMDASVAREVRLADIAALPIREELRDSAVTMLADMM